MNDLMPLDEAWRILGRDLSRIRSTIMSVRPDKREGVARKAMEAAKKAAKKAMAESHPDRCPGDPKAADRFRSVQRAMESVEEHTNQFIEKLRKAASKAPRAGFIEVDGLK